MSRSVRLALLVALALRLLLWALPLHQLANDEIEYVAVARDLLAGRGWRFYESYHWLRAPLYPLFLAGSLWLAGGDLKLAALPNIALSLLNVLLFAAIAREITPSRRATAMAAWLAALLLTLATFASLFMLETLFATLLAGTLLALLRYRQRRSLALIALAGLLLGLAALTRSLALPLLPLGCCYLLTVNLNTTGPWRWIWPLHGVRLATRPAALAACTLAACTLLTIAPWTVRNYLAYGRFVLIETGLSYNTWAFNEPREDEETIFRTLEQIANPAERADYASAKGLARLRQDPAILLRKLDDNWAALWRVKPIEDRFIQQNYYSDAPLPYFVAALLLDDALALLIITAGACGLLLVPGWRERLLLGGWLLATVAGVLLTHGESRYRHALYPALLPYAAVALASLPAPSPRSLCYRLPALLLALLLSFTFLAAYPWEWAGQRMSRGLHQLRGDLVLFSNNQAGAIASYTAAAAAQPDSVDALLVLAQAQLRQGDTAAAIGTYQAAWRLRPTYVPASASLGDLLRSLGDEQGAREAFAGSYVREQEVLDWSWHNLTSAPPSKIDVGGGLDFGYLSGVYPAEEQQGALARWTNGEAQLRLPGGLEPRQLQLRLAAPRQEPGSVTARLCVDERCQQLRVGPGWRTYTFLLPETAAAQQVVMLQSDWFVGSGDGRRLGLLIDTSYAVICQTGTPGR